MNKANVPSQSLTSTVLSVISLLVALFSLYSSFMTEDRANKLFYAERLSDIKVTTKDFELVGNSMNEIPMAKFRFQIANYTGFEAKNVSIDANLEGAWIQEWFKATKKGLTNKLEPLTELEKIDLQNATTSLEQYNFSLDSGQKRDIVFQGSFHYSPSKDNFIAVRVKWTSENGADLDKCYSFRILRTEAYGAHSFSPIPIFNKQECL